MLSGPRPVPSLNLVQTCSVLAHSCSQTNKHTDTGENITSLPEETKGSVDKNKTCHISLSTHTTATCFEHILAAFHASGGLAELSCLSKY